MQQCAAADRFLVATRRGRYPHTDDGVEVRRVFHKLRSLAIENFNGQFKGIFDAHGSVPDPWPRPHPALRPRRRLRSIN